MSEGRIVGLALVLLLPLFVGTGIVSARGGYATASFWRSERDRKLERITEHTGEWLWLHGVWVVLLVVLAGGMAGAATLVSDAGEPALAGIGVGIFLVSVVAWLVGVLLQGPPAAIAARVLREEGRSPSWLEPLFTAVGWVEVTYVAGTAASYVILGAAMVDSEVPAAWAGWVAIVVGALTILGSVFTRGAVTFPELPLVVPIVIGVAFLVA
jgi:hypothetical protein